MFALNGNIEALMISKFYEQTLRTLSRTIIITSYRIEMLMYSNEEIIGNIMIFDNR